MQGRPGVLGAEKQNEILIHSILFDDNIHAHKNRFSELSTGPGDKLGREATQQSAMLLQAIDLLTHFTSDTLPLLCPTAKNRVRSGFGCHATA